MNRYKGGYQIVKFEHDVINDNGFTTHNEDDEKLFNSVKSNKPILIDFTIFNESEDVRKHYICLFNVTYNDDIYTLVTLYMNTADDFSCLYINVDLSTRNVEFYQQVLQ